MTFCPAQDLLLSCAPAHSIKLINDVFVDATVPSPLDKSVQSPFMPIPIQHSTDPDPLLDDPSANDSFPAEAFQPDIYPEPDGSIDDGDNTGTNNSEDDDDKNECEH